MFLLELPFSDYKTFDDSNNSKENNPINTSTTKTMGKSEASTDEITCYSKKLGREETVSLHKNGNTGCTAPSPPIRISLSNQNLRKWSQMAKPLFAFEVPKVPPAVDIKDQNPTSRQRMKFFQSLLLTNNDDHWDNWEMTQKLEEKKDPVSNSHLKSYSRLKRVFRDSMLRRATFSRSVSNVEKRDIVYLSKGQSSLVRSKSFHEIPKISKACAIYKKEHSDYVKKLIDSCQKNWRLKQMQDNHWKKGELVENTEFHAYPINKGVDLSNQNAPIEARKILTQKRPPSGICNQYLKNKRRSRSPITPSQIYSLKYQLDQIYSLESSSSGNRSSSNSSSPSCMEQFEVDVPPSKLSELKKHKDRLKLYVKPLAMMGQKSNGNSKGKNGFQHEHGTLYAEEKEKRNIGINQKLQESVIGVKTLSSSLLHGEPQTTGRVFDLGDTRKPIKFKDSTNGKRMPCEFFSLGVCDHGTSLSACKHESPVSTFRKHKRHKSSDCLCPSGDSNAIHNKMSFSTKQRQKSVEEIKKSFENLRPEELPYTESCRKNVIDLGSVQKNVEQLRKSFENLPQSSVTFVKSESLSLATINKAINKTSNELPKPPTSSFEAHRQINSLYMSPIMSRKKSSIEQRKSASRLHNRSTSPKGSKEEIIDKIVPMQYKSTPNLSGMESLRGYYYIRSPNQFHSNQKEGETKTSSRGQESLGQRMYKEAGEGFAVVAGSNSMEDINLDFISQNLKDQSFFSTKRTVGDVKNCNGRFGDRSSNLHEAGSQNLSQSKAKLINICQKVKHSNILGKIIALQCSAKDEINSGMAKPIVKAKSENCIPQIEYLDPLDQFNSNSLKRLAKFAELEPSESSTQQNSKLNHHCPIIPNPTLFWSRRYPSCIDQSPENYSITQKHDNLKVENVHLQAQMSRDRRGIYESSRDQPTSLPATLHKITESSDRSQGKQ